MNVRKQALRRQKFLRRDYQGMESKLKLNYDRWCCKTCYYGWGPGSHRLRGYSLDNAQGKLKKYWKDRDYMEEA